MSSINQIQHIVFGILFCSAEKSNMTDKVVVEVIKIKLTSALNAY